MCATASNEKRIKDNGHFGEMTKKKDLFVKPRDSRLPADGATRENLQIPAVSQSFFRWLTPSKLQLASRVMPKHRITAAKCCSFP
jgi:hypothetical protein